MSISASNLPLPARSKVGDRNSQGVTAYKFGTNQASRDYFRELMSTDSSQTLVSPDHIMEFVIPQMNAAFPPPSQP